MKKTFVIKKITKTSVNTLVVIQWSETKEVNDAFGKRIIKKQETYRRWVTELADDVKEGNFMEIDPEDYLVVEVPYRLDDGETVMLKELRDRA